MHVCVCVDYEREKGKRVHSILLAQICRTKFALFFSLLLFSILHRHRALLLTHFVRFSSIVPERRCSRGIGEIKCEFTFACTHFRLCLFFVFYLCPPVGVCAHFFSLVAAAAAAAHFKMWTIVHGIYHFSAFRNAAIFIIMTWRCSLLWQARQYGISIHQTSVSRWDAKRWETVTYALFLFFAHGMRIIVLNDYNINFVEIFHLVSWIFGEFTAPSRCVHLCSSNF